MEIVVQTEPRARKVPRPVAGSEHVLALTGEIDLSEAPAVRERGESAIADTQVSTVVIDLAGVTFLDSTGLGALVGLHKLAEDAGKPLLLRRMTPPVAKVLRLTGLDDVFAVDERV